MLLYSYRKSKWISLAMCNLSSFHPCLVCVWMCVYICVLSSPSPFICWCLKRKPENFCSIYVVWHSFKCIEDNREILFQTRVSWAHLNWSNSALVNSWTLLNFRGLFLFQKLCTLHFNKNKNDTAIFEDNCGNSRCCLVFCVVWAVSKMLMKDCNMNVFEGVQS